MKALVHIAAHRLELCERPLPRPGPGQVRIRTAACAICATDLIMLAGWERTPLGAIPGHEWSGAIDEVGAGVDHRLIGRRCVAENVLSDGGEVGFEHPGGYAEYLLTEAVNLQFLPDDFPLVAATLVEPLAVCVRGLRHLGEVSGKVVIFGDGPIGLLLVLLLAAPGREILLVGGRDRRLALAGNLGAVRTLNYHHLGNDLATGLSREIDLPIPTVIEASGSPAALKASLQLVRAGKILELGEYGNACADFPWNTILLREIALIGSNASAAAWPEAVKLAIAHREKLQRLVTHVFPVAQFEQALAVVRDRRQDAVKGVLNWMPDP